MSTPLMANHTKVVGSLDTLGDLLDLLLKDFRVIGPTVKDNVIIYDDIADPNDLPRGLTDEQDGGHYRLIPRSDGALFGYAVGPHSWKAQFLPSRLELWRAETSDDTLSVAAAEPPNEKRALLGVRACELRAIAIHDRVLIAGEFIDPHYKSQRDNTFIIAVNCTQAGGTCFCASMNAGPAVTGGYDLLLTELVSESEHLFMIETGSSAGEAVIEAIRHRPATEMEINAARNVVAKTAADMGRKIPPVDLHDLLLSNVKSENWTKVAERCLSCGNCTMVCPTCFCTTVDDSSDFDGKYFSRTRRWDSCFSLDFSYVHGGEVRASVASRYRQWITHKLATWIDQFGESGCVGCGRCITWCPVGIDITEEVWALGGQSQLAGS